MRTQPDHLLNVNEELVGRAAFRQLMATQGLPTAAQIMGAACVLQAIGEEMQVHPDKLLLWARNLMKQHGSVHPNFRAITMYVHERL